jgi:hypothetical protein
MVDWTAADLSQNEFMNLVRARVLASEARVAVLEARCKAIEDERAAMYERFKQHDLLGRVEKLERKVGTFFTTA